MRRTKLFLTLLAVGAAGCARPSAAEPVHERVVSTPGTDGPTIDVATASRGFVRIASVGVTEGWPALRAPGRVVFREGALARIGSPVTARVEQVHVGIGQRVRRGDPLVTMESPEALALRSSASSSREVERAAQAELARVRRLVEDGVANERELLDAELRTSSAVIEATRARSTVSWIGSGGGRRVVVRAPIDGVVLSLEATVGAVVGADEHLAEVGDPERVWIECELFQSDLGTVDVGRPARVSLGADDALEGRVVAIGADVRDGSRTAVVRIQVDALPETLRPGAYVRVEIASPRPLVVVPSTAVVVRDGRRYAVYVEPEPGSFELQRRNVTVGTSFDGQVSIVSGLEPGERIVTSGTLLVDGAADQLL